MRSRIILIVTVLAIVAASCSSGSDTQASTDEELAWCAQVDDGTVFDAIWDAADELGVDSIGTFLLDKAGVVTDVDPRDIVADDLTDEELASLQIVGDEFDASDVLWIEYINSPDGSKACISAYAAVNG